jgi:hypothetical protein
VYIINNSQVVNKTYFTSEIWGRRDSRKIRSLFATLLLTIEINFDFAVASSGVTLLCDLIKIR